MVKVNLSVVIPAYEEEETVSKLYEEIKEVLDDFEKNHEIIFIDDGSTDDTYEELQELADEDSKVKVIKFRRNYGQTAALDAGFKQAEGDVVVPMDADLQNDPKDIPKLVEKLEEGYDCVSGWRYNRKDGFFKKIFSKLAGFLRRMMTGERIHDSGCTLKAYQGEALERLDLYGEMHRYIPALLRWRGYKITELKVNHRERKHGRTKYSVNRLMKGFLDLLLIKFWMQYSTRPVHLFGSLGVFLSGAGFLIALYLTFMKIFYGIALGDRPLLLLAVLMIIVGVQFFMFGLLADIMIKKYYEDETPYEVEEVI